MGAKSNRCKYEAIYYDYETKKHETYKCNNPSLKGSDFCMFHDREFVEKYPHKVRDEFLKILENAIRKEVTLYCIGYNVPSFSIGTLRKKVGELKFKKPVYFTHAHFLDKVDFSAAEFQVANFMFAEFQKKAYFDLTKFQEVDFPFAEFQKAYFPRAEFQKAYFFSAKFQVANFSNAKFQTAGFPRAEFQKAYFPLAKFQNFIYFTRTKFPVANFFLAEFQGEVEFYYTKFPSLNLNLNKIKKSKNIPIIFDYCTFRKRVRFIGGSDNLLSLQAVSFKGVDLRNVEFHEVKWLEKKEFFGLINRKIIIDELLMDEQKNYEEVSRIYNQLRKNYESKLLFAEASNFFIGEMEAIRKSKGKLGSIPYLLYKYIAMYGESALLPLVIYTPIIIIAFAVLRLIFNPNIDFLNAFIDSLAAYFQVPRGIQALDIIERLISVPILGSAFIALRRKFERRK